MSLRVVRCPAQRHEMDHTGPELRTRRTAAGAVAGRRYRRSRRRSPAAPATQAIDRGAPLPTPSDAPDGTSDPQDGAVADTGGTAGRRPRTRLDRKSVV